MKRRTTSLAIREMQFKTMIRYHYIPYRMAKIKRVITSNAGEDAEKLNDSCVAGGNVKWYSDSGKKVWWFLLKLKMDLSNTQQLYS